jgi:enterochelin esterase family protein
MVRTAALSVLFCSAISFAQTPNQPPVPLQSHQINPDRTITFRYADPAATKVLLSIDAFPKPQPMTRDASGVWSVTTPMLPPDFYQYHFSADGMVRLDPLNPNTLRSFISSGNVVLLPGNLPAPWEITDVPHGRVDHYLYTTHIGKNLPANQEPYIVYTPPGYDARRKGGYPVLYLLHGWSDTEYAWTENAHADLILDRLLADGKIVPMIVVMPQGYGDLNFVTHGWSAWNVPSDVRANVDLYSKMMLTEIIPAVEHEYNTATGRDSRAIAGLSMGGLESLTIGLNHPDEFAWVGGMSSAVFNGHDQMFDRYIPGLDATKADLRLLWVACGQTDGLITANREFVAWTKTKGFATVAVETPGAHTWLTWRDNLVTLAPLLFR